MAQMTRAEIRLAQQAINRLGIKDERGRRIALRVDGIVGPKTMAAMQMAQSQQQAAQSSMPPVPRPRPQMGMDDRLDISAAGLPQSRAYPTPGAGISPNLPPNLPLAASGPPGGQGPGAINNSLRALMAGPTPGAPPFMHAGPPGGMGGGGNMAMGQPPRFGGLPMRDPDSAMQALDPRNMSVFGDVNRIMMAGPQTPRGVEQMAMRNANRDVGLGDMMRSFMPPSEDALVNGGMIPPTRPDVPFGLPRRMADGFAPPPPSAPMPPPPPPQLGFLDSIRNALGVAVPGDVEPAQADPQGDLAHPQKGARVMLKGQPYQFDGTQWRPAQ